MPKNTRSSLRVGFGVTVLSRATGGKGVDGIGSYTRELGRELQAIPALALSPVSFGVAPDTQFPLDTYNLIRLPSYVSMLARSLVGLRAFEGSSNLAKRIDLFHATDHLIPRLPDVPVVATIMDAIPLAHPEMIRTRFARLKGVVWRRTGRWADHVITISAFSRQDIVHHFGVAEEHVSVVPLGVDERYFHRFSSAERHDVLSRLGLPEQFFLFVGTLQPRKNLQRVIAAHAILPQQMQRQFPLVVVGRAGWGCESVVAQLCDPVAAGRLFWLNYLSDQDVRVLLQSALALVFVSLYEGFGLPVIEAFASGLPVIASNSTSIPEVAGDAAVLVDPENVGAIASAMREMIVSAGLSAQLSAKGLERARQFTWQACARQTFKVYQQLV